MFVGITRARQELQLSLAQYRDFRGQRKMTVPSQFLMELPRGRMEQIEPESSSASWMQPSYEEPVWRDEPSPPSRPLPAGVQLTTARRTGQGQPPASRLAGGLSPRHVSSPSPARPRPRHRVKRRRRFTQSHHRVSPARRPKEVRPQRQPAAAGGEVSCQLSVGSSQWGGCHGHACVAMRERGQAGMLAVSPSSTSKHGTPGLHPT